MNVFISGSIAYDRIMNFPGKFADHILPDRIHQLNVSFGLEKLTIQFGGTAGNIVYNLSLLGEHPYVVSQAGNDFANYRARFKTMGVKLDYVRSVPNETCSTAHIITDQTDNQIAAFHFGAMKQAATGAAPLRSKLLKKLKQQPALGLLAAGNLGDMLWLAETYRKQGIDYIFDPGQQTVWLQAAQMRTILRGAGAMIVNDYELALVTKKLGITAAALAKQLPILIVTLGAKGADWYVAGKKTHITTAKPKKVLDPTGAGDAYRAGVVLGLLRGWDVKTAGQVSALCATYAIEHYGTQQHTYTKQQFQQRYKKAFKQNISL